MKYQRHSSTSANCGDELEQYILGNLDRAERDWEQVREHLLGGDGPQDPSSDSAYRTAMPVSLVDVLRDALDMGQAAGPSSLQLAGCTTTRIPGHALIDNEIPSVGEFVAFVADMRASSSHFDQPLPANTVIECGLQRIFYETSALLPAIAHTVAKGGGCATEVLGDGMLVLFSTRAENRCETIRHAHRVACECIGPVLRLVNSVLRRRYQLPPLEIGIGLACGKAIVRVVSLDANHPKVFGRCIWEATKLSDGRNAVRATEGVRAILVGMAASIFGEAACLAPR